MEIDDKFRISSHLKDIIGRDLVTNEYVAIFELVKNSFDAAANRIDIEFDPDRQRLSISDDGHGMSSDDIREKWLFVAYSEKADAQTDNYRDKIKPGGQFAGNKGIGRFACDTLGERLSMYSRAKCDGPIATLSVDWTLFEENSQDEFQTINVERGYVSEFPELTHVGPPEECGTVLVIEGARHRWDGDRIIRLRRDLAKLIDPFGTTDTVEVYTWLVDGALTQIQDVDGLVRNEISDLLEEKTSRIEVHIRENEISTTLWDRNRKIYELRESSPYDELEGCEVRGMIYYLNRSAKHTFTSRMGVQPVKFGSVFLFLNGFRVFPIGEEMDDTLGLSRRKQQGQSRYLGTRDVLGRVDVLAPPKMFREVSSRDAGLVADARSRALYDAIRRHMIFRLERYVVGVNWQDKLDQDRDTPVGLETDSARARILDVIGSLAKTSDVEVVYFDEDVVRVADDPEATTEATLRAMSALAESRGDEKLLGQIEQARRRIEELEASREEAREFARRALEERQRSDARIAALERQAAFLGSSRDIDVERVQLLMHQAAIHVGHLKSAIANAGVEVRRALLTIQEPDDSTSSDEVQDLLAAIRQRLRRAGTSLSGATLSSDRLRALLSFAPNIRVDLETDRVDGDLLKFLREYFEVRLEGISGIPDTELDADGLSLNCEFSPVDIAVVVDNLLDNAHKAKATRLELRAKRKGPHALTIHVVDDGLGINQSNLDASKIFERGYSGYKDGTGLGLYSVKQILEGMGGSIELVGDGSRADFEIMLPGDVQ
ncbi:MAG: histidine kinase [Boseongicola sp. SB0677_bin_26]|nr:histidine kinase [Boseongicola sp. SB0665_bin_10]MYG26737.1 histidine kinase [Boseongicola sp. SB0677_bin_26]